MTFYSVLIRPGEEWTDLYEILLRKEPLSTENGKAPAEAGAFPRKATADGPSTRRWRCQDRTANKDQGPEGP